MEKDRVFLVYEFSNTTFSWEVQAVVASEPMAQLYIKQAQRFEKKEMKYEGWQVMHHLEVAV